MSRKTKHPKPPKVGRRPGWGRPITLDFPLDADAQLEDVRARLGLDRVNFVRSAVMERLAREAA